MKQDGITGERITKRELRKMTETKDERFGKLKESAIYVSGFKPDVTNRIRYHEQSETIAMMNRLGVPTHPADKPPVYSMQEYTENVYYQGSEIKAIGRESVKIKGARAIGLLTGEEANSLVYCFHTAEQRWDARTERRLKDVIGMKMKDREMKTIIIGVDVRAADIMRTESGKHHLLYELMAEDEKTYYVPYDEYGLFLMRAAHMTNKIQTFGGIVKEKIGLRPVTNALECDGCDENGKPHLIALDYDIYRIKMFRLGLESRGLRGYVHCFDFQRDEMMDYFENDKYAYVKDFDARKFAERMNIEWGR